MRVSRISYFNVNSLQVTKILFYGLLSKSKSADADGD